MSFVSLSVNALLYLRHGELAMSLPPPVQGSWPSQLTIASVQLQQKCSNSSRGSTSTISPSDATGLSWCGAKTIALGVAE